MRPSRESWKAPQPSPHRSSIAAFSNPRMILKRGWAARGRRCEWISFLRVFEGGGGGKGEGEAAETTQALAPQLGPQVLDQIERRGAGLGAARAPLRRRQGVGEARRGPSRARRQQQPGVGSHDQLRHRCDRAGMSDLRLSLPPTASFRRGS